jgi:Zn-dependent peptidase ImmA (M78 family)
MASSERKAIAIAKADQLLKELQIEEPSEIDIERMAIFNDADVRYAALHGMDGCLVRRGNSAVITVRNSLPYERQKRFVIGHELGHFFLHPNTRQIETVDKEQAANWSERQETEEYEANLFAAELLLPKQLISERISGKNPSFELIKGLAEEFRMTLTATAVQFVRTTAEECVLVSSANRQRLWFIPSRGFSFTMLEDIYIHGHSCAAEVNESKRSSRCAEIEAGYWLEGFRGDHKSLITEDALYFPTLRRALSLLWIHEAI